MLTSLLLLSLNPLLPTAHPQNNPAPATVTVSTNIQTTTSTSTLPPSSPSSSSLSPTSSIPNPTSAQSKFFQDYASYYKAQATNPFFTPSVLSNFIPLTAAQAQENSYFAALMTATSGTVPLPPYITALPLDQQSYVQAFHAHVTSIASVDYGRSALVENNTASQNGTANNNESVTAGPAGNNSTRPTPPLQEPTTTPPPPLVPAPSLSAGNATNTTDSEGAGSPSLSTGGVHRMAAGALAGMLGVAMLL